MDNKKIVMTTMFIVLLLIIIMILLGLLNWFNHKQTYQLFKLERQGTTTKFCEHYYEECVCYGKLWVMESYPPQYQCNGMKFCKDMNEIICRE